ncbi:cupin domain-containing protein [Pontibacter sp. G13]|uniref:helix-turn-helix domain-containing protein n=1 Tax=Pontibacter sp. G13 TaxID=3074898 RepID=UPI00288C05A4|nr:cupin domain-containing protein [Pontibacter sp. G13]WNJ16846.1 cupin domain-containing protein [Pontibacter sp. G13]
MEAYLIGIGRKLRKIRKDKKLSLSNVAGKAGVSAGLVSRIENGRTLPSLPVLINLVGALEEELSEFFLGIERDTFQKYTVIRREDLKELERENAAGFSYQLIYNRNLLSVGLEAVILTVQPGASREKTQTDAFEFKYMLSGRVTYLIDEEAVELGPGDSLFFDGRHPHNPQNNFEEPAVMLVMYLFLDSGSGN